MILNSNQPSPALYDAAFEFARAGKIEEAEKRIRLLLKRHPEHPEVLHLLGVVLLESGRLVESGKILQKATGLRPKQAQFHYHYGLVLLRNGDVIGAGKAFNSAVKLDDNFHAARYNEKMGLETGFR